MVACIRITLDYVQGFLPVFLPFILEWRGNTLHTAQGQVSGLSLLARPAPFRGNKVFRKRLYVDLPYQDVLSSQHLMKKKENNYAFIDSQNLNLSIRAQGWTLDYRKFRRYLEDKYGITKAYLFLGYVPQYQDLYTSLQEDGFILIFKPTLKLPDGKVKGNVDAELVLHAMVEYPKYDKALIVTNDGDFYCLVDYLIKQDKLVKLMIPNRKAFSSLFRKLMAHIVFLDNMRGKLEFIKRHK